MINSVDPALTQTASESSLFDGLDGEAFLHLLIAQLRYQDPMAPTDPSAMLEQTSQFANVEAIQKLSTLQTQALGYTQFQAATTLIGREVSFPSLDPGAADGVDSARVIGVRTSATGPRLGLDNGNEIDLLEVLSVAESVTTSTLPLTATTGATQP